MNDNFYVTGNGPQDMIGPFATYAEAESAAYRKMSGRGFSIRRASVLLNQTGDGPGWGGVYDKIQQLKARDRAARSVLAEIRADIERGGWNVSGFADLHDFVDANEYVAEVAETAAPDLEGEAFYKFCNEVIEFLDGALR